MSPTADPADASRRRWVAAASAAGAAGVVATSFPFVALMAQFDLAGRFLVTAPSKLEVPPHRYRGGSMLVIGD